MIGGYEWKASRVFVSCVTCTHFANNILISQNKLCANKWEDLNYFMRFMTAYFCYSCCYHCCRYLSESAITRVENIDYVEATSEHRWKVIAMMIRNSSLLNSMLGECDLAQHNSNCQLIRNLRINYYIHNEIIFQYDSGSIFGRMISYCESMISRRDK